MAHTPHEIRNIALFGHGNSGKTAVIDALAFVHGVTKRQGDSADGTSISNTEPEEKERHQTLSNHVFSFKLGDCHLNVLDTPGHPDFLASVIDAFTAVEMGVLCISGTSGVTYHSQRLWNEAGRAGLGRALLITHVDSENTSFEKTFAECAEVFGDVVVPLSYPDGDGADFSKIYDVLGGEGPKAQEYMERLEERVAEANDELLTQYLENGTISKEEVIKNLPAAIAKRKVVPVFGVSPKKDLGLKKFVFHVEEDFPSPVSFGSRGAGKPGTDDLSEFVEPNPDEPFAAVVFKVVVDPYVGRISYLRCMRGTAKADMPVVNARTGDAAKLSHPLRVLGKETKEINEMVAGDLFAIGKIEGWELGDTICDPGTPLEFLRAEYPEPVYSLAVEPKSRGDEQKINQGLEKLAAEDPTFRARRDETTGELVVAGNSPMHLEVQFGRLSQRYGVEVEHHSPTIPYRETIHAKADGHHRHKKQSGGRGQFAEVYLRVGPKESGEGFEFIDSVVGGSIPRQFIPEVEKGIRKFLDKGGLAGFPIQDCWAEVYDGKYHDVDSDQLSFQLAGERAFLDGFEKAKPVLLEPIMDVEIHVPERFTGDVAGNLSSIRGRMSGMEMEAGIQIIKAQVPLKEMQEYSTQLRSITAGEGSFTMKASHYEQVPPQLQQEIVKQRKASDEDS